MPTRACIFQVTVTIWKGYLKVVKSTTQSHGPRTYTPLYLRIHLDLTIFNPPITQFLQEQDVAKGGVMALPIESTFRGGSGFRWGGYFRYDVLLSFDAAVLAAIGVMWILVT
jgi:hypothetical protein